MGCSCQFFSVIPHLCTGPNTIGRNAQHGDHIEICDLLIQKRGVDILINTFIDKMPELIRKKTNKLHAKFNSYGAATGRFSSADPNLQNIP